MPRANVSTTGSAEQQGVWVVAQCRHLHIPDHCWHFCPLCLQRHTESSVLVRFRFKQRSIWNFPTAAVFTYLYGNPGALCVDDAKVHAAASYHGQLVGCWRAEGHIVDPTWHGHAGQQLEGLAAPQSHLWIWIITYKGKENEEEASRLTDWS